MSDTTTPAGTTGGDTTTINTATINAMLSDLPPRIRVHALAKVLGVSSRDVLTALTSLEEPVRGAQSSVTREVAMRVVDTLAGPSPESPEAHPEDDPQPTGEEVQPASPLQLAPIFASASPIFLPPDASSVAPPVMPAQPQVEEDATDQADDVTPDEPSTDEADDVESGDDDASGRRRRRRGRRGRGRGKGAGQGGDADDQAEDHDEEPGQDAEDAGPDADTTEDGGDAEEEASADGGSSRRRRRRRRRKGAAEDEAAGVGEDDPPNTVVHVRDSREDKDKDKAADTAGRDEVRSVRGSTRLEAKRQRRRDGREAGRRRAPILSEAEFLARREAVDRKMVVRQRDDRFQMGVLEDGILVEHFVTSAGTGSLVGNVYLGRVQNVLPSMEAAFVDIGRGRNAVLYAGEVDWDAAGLEGKARKIEQALSTGDSVLVQVTKDPVGHKGARLTTQISLPGRFLVYVPGGGATGISRKLPENERRRLKDILKRIVPEDAGVIIRTASEGISEEELARDVRRLQAQWQVIKDKAEGANGVKKAGAPSLLYEEPDLLIKVVRDLFTEDFSGLVVQGDDAWDTIDAYVRHVAPDLQDRLRRHVSNNDVFSEYRIEEQLLKALDRKVWLPSGGYLIIDRTEAMTVIDVNTGKFTGSGGNLEETVTRNNLESAEEIVRQLRLRDIGGIIVIDFIDMVLESNRDLVLRRLTECLGRDRTRHQVAEVTSLGLVQMTRKRVGTGLLEAFSAVCEHCRGRGVIVTTDQPSKSGGGHNHQHEDGGAPGTGKQATHGSGRRRGRGHGDETPPEPHEEVAALVRAEPTPEQAPEPAEPTLAEPTPAEPVVAEDRPAEPAAAQQKPAMAELPAPEPEPAAPAELPAPTVPAEPPASAEITAATEPAVPAVSAEPAPSVSAGSGPRETAEEPPQPADQPVAPRSAVADGGPVGSGVNGHPRPTDPEQPSGGAAEAVPVRRRVRRTASRPAGPPVSATKEG